MTDAGDRLWDEIKKSARPVQGRISTDELFGTASPLAQRLIKAALAAALRELADDPIVNQFPATT